MVVAHLFPDLSLTELPGRDDRGRAAGLEEALRRSSMWQWFMRFNVGRRDRIVTAFIAVGMIVVLFLHFHDGFVLTLADRAMLLFAVLFCIAVWIRSALPPN